eukprot:gene8329-8514_t
MVPVAEVALAVAGTGVAPWETDVDTGDTLLLLLGQQFEDSALWKAAQLELAGLRPVVAWVLE